MSSSVKEGEQKEERRSSASKTDGGDSSTPSAAGYLRREEIIGKPVVTTDAVIIGNVKDIAVSMDGKVALQVDKQGGEAPNEIFVGSEEIQAVGDVVLLRYSSRPVATPRISSQSTSQLGTASPAQASPVSPPPPPLASAAQFRVCPNCRYSNSASSRFCIKCGTSLAT